MFVASPPTMLAVDLDGTLIRSDLLFESFWSALALSWTVPFVAAHSLLGGKAALKQRLSGLGRVDIASLPYNEAVLDYVRAWRAAGGRTALVTAASQSLAEGVARHLGLFDEVHGSSERTNLKGARKAEFLTERFGERGFAYVGDAEADLPVWAGAGRAVTVSQSAGLRSRVEALGQDFDHIATPPAAPLDYLRALRPHQWLKNLLLFVPMLAGHQLDAATFGAALLAFCAFCLVASSVYVVNDLLDLGADRAHPRKRLRPFASGAIPLAHGTAMAPLLLVAGLALAVPLGPAFLLMTLAYVTLSSLYSLFIKRRTFVDIATLAALYTLRLVAGGIACAITLSPWLIAFSLSLFVALAAVKRLGELTDGSTHGRAYRAAHLRGVTAIAFGAGNLAVPVLALYVLSPAVTALYTSPSLLWVAVGALAVWINRMVLVTRAGRMHDDPLVFAATDRVSLVLVLVAAGAAGAAALL